MKQFKQGEIVYINGSSRKYIYVCLMPNGEHLIKLATLIRGENVYKEITEVLNEEDVRIKKATEKERDRLDKIYMYEKAIAELRAQAPDKASESLFGEDEV